MKCQDGSVEILHPDDFEWLQCLANGGFGSHGYYSETIEQVAPNPTMGLRDQLSQALEDEAEATPYQHNGLDGYIATSIAGYGVTFLGAVPGSDQLLQVSVECDCEVEVKDLTNLLSSIRPLR